MVNPLTPRYYELYHNILIIILGGFYILKVVLLWVLVSVGFFNDFTDSVFFISFNQMQHCGRRWRNSLQHPYQSQYLAPQPCGESRSCERGPGMRQQERAALPSADCRPVLQKVCTKWGFEVTVP